jgi:SAM-dependent methyltransferase
MRQATRQRIDYFRWSLARIGSADPTCPACGSSITRVVDRKYMVTSLLECGVCRLRFRLPKEEPNQAADFYQESYTEGMTTQMPSDAALQLLLCSGFRGTEKDFEGYIGVCRAAGVKAGARILDFGCSWGYGSWQFREAGFDVYSSEISRPRRDYARDKLGCRMVEQLSSLDGSIDCFFSAHVIEHLPNPHVLIEFARRAIKPDGVIVTFCPNGDPRSSWANHYSDLWGRKHPLVITPAFVESVSRQYRFSAQIHSNPYDTDAIARAESQPVPAGDELCIIWKRA